MSQRLVKYYFDQDVWETDVARFGIDIWMTTTAVVGGFEISQARLGVKVHGEKDPAADLGPMFRQVVGTIFQLMEQNEDHWQKVKGSREVPILGEEVKTEPAPFEIDQDGLIEYFKVGYNNFAGVWERVIDGRDLEVVRKLVTMPKKDDFFLPIETWVRIVYGYARHFHLTPRQRFKVLDTLVPLYNARVASLINELKDLDPEGAERSFEEHAQSFENMKDYLIKIWKEVHHG